MASQQLALPCSLLALKSEGFEVLEVLSADRLHGFGLRVAFDLLLAVRRENRAAVTCSKGPPFLKANSKRKGWRLQFRDLDPGEPPNNGEPSWKICRQVCQDA